MEKQFAGMAVIKPGEAPLDAGGFEWAISADTTGAKTLKLGVARVPPGTSVPAHTHPTETSALLTRGRASFRFGEKLDERVEMHAGDYAFVGANVIHTEETLGDEEAEFIMAVPAGWDIAPVDPSDPGWAPQPDGG